MGRQQRRGHCVICGERLADNHKCDEKRLQKIDRLRDSYDPDERMPRTPVVSERLEVGFAMLEEDDVVYPWETR